MSVENSIIEGKATLTIAAQVLGFSRQSFYTWAGDKLRAREKQEVEMCQAICEIHGDDPEFGYRLIADELADHG